MNLLAQKSLFISLSSASILMMLPFQSAHADLLDAFKSKTESKDIFLVYDLENFSAPVDELKDKVKQALTYRGDNAFIKETLLPADLPKFPAKIEFKTMNLGPVSMTIPSCPGSAFSISSNDASGASYGETSKYMACAFPYAGGYRVNFYASYVNQSGDGVMGISKAIAKSIVSAAGLNTSPQAFIETSIAKMEELFNASGYKFQIVEMRPTIPGKNLVADPILKKQASETKRTGDRAKRMAARAELAKLSIDASDRARLIKAIQSQDEDIVALFVEAGAMDFSAKDEAGKQLMEYATSPSIKAYFPVASNN